MEKHFILNGILYKGRSAHNIRETKPADDPIIIEDGIVYICSEVTNAYERKNEGEHFEYEENEYLINGINYDANTIKNADAADIEQLATDSFFEGWERAKRYFQNQGYKIP